MILACQQVLYYSKPIWVFYLQNYLVRKFSYFSFNTRYNFTRCAQYLNASYLHVNEGKSAANLCSQVVALIPYVLQLLFGEISQIANYSATTEAMYVRLNLTTIKFFLAIDF
jgi:hypothetical protein